MLPAERLEAIRTRVAAATPGPWEAEGHRHPTPGCRCLSCYEEPTGYLLDTPRSHWCEDKVEAAHLGCDMHPLLSYEDALFAAHAREDVPALLAEVERLQHLLLNPCDGQDCDGNELHCHACPEATEDRLIQERDELREQVQAFKALHAKPWWRRRRT